MKTHNELSNQLISLEADVKFEASMRYGEAKNMNLIPKRDNDTPVEISRMLKTRSIYENLEYLKEVEERVKTAENNIKSTN